MKSYQLNPEDRAVLSLRSIYSKYGYRQYRMSKFEEYDLYVKNKSFLVSDNIITFTDTTGKLMALKPDVTLSIVKNLKKSGDLQKVYYNENVYRISQGTGSFKEIMQTGLECIGDIDDYTIYEVILLAAKSLESISEDFILDISHLGIISDVINSLSGDDNIRASLMTCISEKNLSSLKEICAREKIDGALLEKMIKSYGALEDVEDILNALSDRKTAERLKKIFSALEKSGFKGKIHIDFSVVNDTNYYNGFVFRGFIKGIASGILSGGQYDNLMSKMGRREKAIGFAVYLDMLDMLESNSDKFDVDTLLIYDDQDIYSVNEAINMLSESGGNVIALKSIPNKLKYRRLAKLTPKGVEILGSDA